LVDACQDERLEFAVYCRSNLFGNADIGTAVEFGGAIISVEVRNPETRYREE
jgi:hypothetical protein